MKNPGMTPCSQKIGIIGAGLSGLEAGRILQRHGASVTLFDKARRPGGRANTREHGPYRFDHGAQFFTVRDPAVRSRLDTWIARDSSRPGRPRVEAWAFRAGPD